MIKKLAYFFIPMQRKKMSISDFRLIVLVLFIPFSLVGCGNGGAAYLTGESDTTAVGDSAIALAGVGAAGAGGYFLGKEYIGGTKGGILGAVAGAAIALGIEQFYNQKRADAYGVGVTDGAAAGRAAVINEVWQREAVFAVPPPWEASGSSSPTIRNVYVPTRSIDGVEYQGDYQRVPVYK